MATYDINLGEFHVASTERLRATIKKNGVPWVGLDSVEFIFEKPDQATQFTRNAVLENDASGIWYYDLTTTDIVTTGYWRLTVKVTDGGTVLRYPYSIDFHVNDQP
jgi:uncharacterized protein YfaS (alpha-2-macroglobulin family)